MKLKAGQAQTILNAIFAARELKLPVKTAYWLARSAKQIGPEAEAFETTRQGLLDRYGKKDKKKKLIIGENGVVDFKDRDAFNVAFKELSDQEFEIKMDALTLDKFEDPEGTMLVETGVMVGLLPLIEEPE